MNLAIPELSVGSVTGIDVALPIAGTGARALAFIIDWLIRSAAGLAWYASTALLYNRGHGLAAPLDPDALWFLLVLTPAAAIYLLYHPVLESATRGSTPGKHLAGVRILASSGATASVAALLIRNVFRVVDCLPLAYAFGLLTTLCTRSHVRLGDMAAGTVLVYLHHGRPRGRSADVHQAVAVLEKYLLLAHEVARARRLVPGSSEHASLETAYARAHATLHSGAWHPGHALLGLFRDDLPAVMHELRPYIAWCTSLFVLAIAAGYWMVHTYPELIRLFASPDLIASGERGQLWTEGLLNIVPSAVLSLQILTNNVVVSLFAYCAGFVFGLGTVYIVGLNGLMLGAVFAFTGQHALGLALLRFIVPHGCVEISIMALSGAAGAAVGAALFRPQQGSRLAAFQHAALQSGKLIVACTLLLIGCGFIEGYLSPDPAIHMPVRLAVGLGYWLLMVALLGGWLFPSRWRHGAVSTGAMGAVGESSAMDAHSDTQIRRERRSAAYRASTALSSRS